MHYTNYYTSYTKWSLNFTDTSETKLQL
jgi:hypothetical protein